MSRYERYNQALQQDKQLQQVEKDIRPEVEKQVSEVSQVERTYNQNLRSAVISNKQVDLRTASQDKKTISQAKQDAQEPLRKITAERAKLQKQKESSVKTFSQLESQGYKKEVRGNRIVYFKEENYRYKTSSGRNREETYRREEYVFASDGTPIQIIQREDYSDGDRRRVDERENVRFDSQGRVRRVETLRRGERDLITDYSFRNDGSMEVRTRDVARENQLKKQLETKKDPEWTTINATLSGVGSSQETEVIKTTKGGVTTTQTTIRSKLPANPVRRIESTKTLQATKTPTAETLLSQNMFVGGGVPGVNQGTDISNIPKINLNIRNPNTPAPGEAMMTAPSDNRRTFTREQTTQMLADGLRQKDQANPVKKFFMKDWAAESQRQRDKFDASGGHDLTAVSFEIGAGFISGSQASGELLRGLVTSPIQTTKNIAIAIPTMPAAIAQKAKTNPGGLIGETLFGFGLGSVATKTLQATRNKLRPATISESPARIRTTAIDNKIQTQAFGNFQVESGLFKRTKQDFSFESSGSLQRVQSFDMPDSAGVTTKKITQTRVEKLLDKPTQQTPRQITEQSTSRKIVRADIEVKIGGAPIEETARVASAPTPKEIFRGEIQTQIKNSKGEIVQTQKVPAELVREGQKQTLFVGGKPFDLKQQVIDTPKGIAIDEIGPGVTAMRQEGAFGLSSKRQTIETTATDLASGSQRKSLTQQVMKDDFEVFGFQSSRSSPGQKRIGQKNQNLLSDKPQTPGEFIRPRTDLAAALPTSKELTTINPRVKGSRSSKISDLQDQPQIFEGVSMKIDSAKLPDLEVRKSIVKDTTATERSSNQIVFKQTLNELENPIKQLETPGTIFNRDLETRTKRTKLESPDMWGERQARSIFGDDFVNQAKATKPIDIGRDPFDTSDMFKGSASSFQTQSQAFTQAPRSSTTSSTIDISKPQTPGRRSSGSQENVMINEPKIKSSSSTSKVLNIDDIKIDASLGADFSKVIPKQISRPAIMPSFAVGNMFSQNFASGFAFDQSQSPAQSQMPGQSNRNEQIFRQETKVSQEVIQDTGFKQASDQVVSQKTIQSNAFDTPIIPPFAPPGFGPGVPPLRTSKSGKKVADPFALGSKKTQKLKGQYAGSLTGLVRGLKTPKDLDKLTGLEVRPIKIKRNF